MTLEEARELRERFEAVVKTLARYCDLLGYLYDHPNDPDYQEVDVRAEQVGRKFGVLCRDLGDWCGAEEYGWGVMLLAAKALAALADRKAGQPA